MYQINYSHIADRKERDKKAIADVRHYLNSAVWETFLYEMGRAEGVGTVDAFTEINVALAFAGVREYPVHALGRKYMPTAYRAWMEGGDDPIPLDKDGFPADQLKP